MYYFKSIKNRTNVFVNFFYKNLRTHVVGLINAIDSEIEKIETSN